jgi:hypothetical protein
MFPIGITVVKELNLQLNVMNARKEELPDVFFVVLQICT